MSDEELLANIYTRLITKEISYRVVREWEPREQEELFKTYLEIAKIATKVYSEDRAKGE
jgi:hypothetical protein